MGKQEKLQQSSKLLGRFAHEVKSQNAADLLDINTIAENFSVPLLSRLYNCPNLINQNLIKTNFPSIDLGCNTSRISFQVTSEKASDKIIETLEKFVTHSLHEQYDKVYIFVITEKQDSYSSKKLKQLIKTLPITFDAEKHVIDYRDLSAKIQTLESDDLDAVHNHIEYFFKEKDKYLQFRETLNSFLDYGKSKVEVEKNTKKYIPSVFVETSSIKDTVRLFAHPLFFYRKIDDEIKRLDSKPLHYWTSRAKEKVIKFDEIPLSSLKKPLSIECLKDRSTSLIEILQDIKSQLEIYTSDTEYEPINKNEWYFYCSKVEGKCHHLRHRINTIITQIEVTQSKIFLITGMAGQGKTNFVCDLIENQFAVFEIPSIFIPARELNNYDSKERIYQYLGNSRYSPKTNSLHELLEILDKIGKENLKPFVIAIDGINEVNDLNSFRGELKTFLSAICEYDYIRILVTCRNEFFEQRFSSILQEEFSDHIHHVRDLRSHMSEKNKDRVLSAYLSHFQITSNLSKLVREFLKNDLLLLRIFSELNEGKRIGYIAAIYKGDLFESYLQKKVSESDIETRPYVVPALHAIVERMIASEQFTHISTRNLDQNRSSVVNKLIAEDIVLRREVPDGGLSGIGDQNISFTYDEMRDYVIADYISEKECPLSTEDIQSLFNKLQLLPIHEGVLSYSYVAARKKSNESLAVLCENDKLFSRHYIHILPLLSPDIQTDEDVTRVFKILRDNNDYHWVLRQVAGLLFNRRHPEDKINISILTSHINTLPDYECRTFLGNIFSRDMDPLNESPNPIVGKLVLRYLNDTESIQSYTPGLLTFLFQISGFSDWDSREQITNLAATLEITDNVNQAIIETNRASSTIIVATVKEMFSNCRGDS